MGLTGPYYNSVRTAMQAAGADWASHFNANASIEVEIQFKSADLDPSLDGVLAFAAPVTYQKTSTSSGVDIVDPGPLYEIKTGTDPNGSEPDAIITFVATSLNEGYFETSTNRIVPPNKYDVLSIATHELGHTLGFITLSNSTSAATILPSSGKLSKTSFGNLLGSGGGFFGGTVFTGDAANTVYGDDVPVDLTSGAHYDSNDVFTNEPAGDLAHSLMSPYGYKGRIAEIGAIDVAILADLGAPVIGTFEAISTSGPVLQITGTSAADVIEVIATGNQYVVKRNFVTTTESFSIDDFDSIRINAARWQRPHHHQWRCSIVLINAGDGNDTVIGGTGDDTINGGSGADKIFGNSGNDLLNGDGGNDNLYGGEGSDLMFGGTGNDFMLGEAGNDFMDGGNDADSLDGGSGNDKLFGGAGNDTLYGGSSRDTLKGGSGGDLLQGGGGEADFADYSDRTAPLSLSIDDKANDGEAGEGDNIDGKIEVIIGGSGADRIGGNGKNNTLYGGEGNDTIDGGAGDDYIEGGSALTTSRAARATIAFSAAVGRTS